MQSLIETNEIPIIDLKYSLNDRQNSHFKNDLFIHQLADELDAALTKDGIAILTNHGIDDEKLQLSSEHFKLFCMLPTEIQNLYQIKLNHGYIQPNIERFTEKETEIRHAFNFGNTIPEKMPNHEVPGFQENLLLLLEEFNQLQSLILTALAVALKIPEHYFLESHTFLHDFEQLGTTFRLLYYPAIFHPKELDQNKIRCGAHCDYGTVTLLSQDSEGGLEVMKPGTSEWRRVGYSPGSIIITTGEILQIWSENHYSAIQHRVVIPQDDYTRKKDRNVRALFVHSTTEYPVAPIQQILNGNNCFEETFITSQKFLEKKIQKTYGTNQ